MKLKVKMAYEKELEKLFSDNRAYSTREVMKAIEKARGKKTNWHMVYYALQKLCDSSKLEKIESKHTILWRRK